MKNPFSEAYRELQIKPKYKYSELLQEYYDIHEASKPYTRAEAKSKFYEFCRSKLFRCKCGENFRTIQARNGHKKGCKI